MAAMGDVVFESRYVEKLIDRFSEDEKLAVASGIIDGEHNVATAPRGPGRMHRFS